MADHAQDERLLRLELEVLRWICSETGIDNRENIPSRLQTVLGELKDYRWRGDEHRVIYGALTTLRPSSGETIAGQLPAQATRMGFPDVDWNLYLQPSGAHESDIEEMIRTLKAGSPAKT
jgi:hypothetical protein